MVNELASNAENGFHGKEILKLVLRPSIFHQIV